MKALKIIIIVILGLIYVKDLYAVNGESAMIDIQETKQRLQDHLHTLTVTIGERSVRVPENLKKQLLISRLFTGALVLRQTNRRIHI